MSAGLPNVLAPELLVAVLSRGGVTTRTRDLTVSVNALAGQTTTVEQPVPLGRAWIIGQPIQLSASYYDDAITVDLLVDNNPIGGLGVTYALNDTATLTPGDQWVVLSGVTLTVVNASAYDSLVNLVLQVLTCDANYYQEVIQPILQQNLAALQEVVTAWRTGHGLKAGIR